MRNGCTPITICAFTVFLGLVHPAHAASCQLGDLQTCRSCEGLEKTIDILQPDKGEYYRGTYWNGLFAAYRLNCQIVGKKLLEHKANPNLGGTLGSFLVTLVRAWPHNNERINAQWIDLTKPFGMDPTWKNPWTNESAIEMIASDEVSVNYPKLWKAIQTK